MTKVEYIRQLEFSLAGKLPKREVSEILRDYSEYFEEGKQAGKTEEEISVSLGIPSAAAAQILSENEEVPAQDKSRAARFWEGLQNRIQDFLHAEKPAAAYGAPDEEPAAEKEPVKAADRLQAPPGKERGSVGKLLLRVLGILLLIPVIMILLPAALLVLGGLLLCILFIAGAMVFLCGAFVLLFICGVTVSVFLPGIGLPVSVTLFVIAGTVFSFAAGVLCMCGVIYLIRGTFRRIRRCFARDKKVHTARNPAYQAYYNAAYADAPYRPAEPYGGQDMQNYAEDSPFVQPFDGEEDGIGQKADPYAEGQAEQAYMQDSGEVDIQPGADAQNIGNGEDEKEENGHA